MASRIDTDAVYDLRALEALAGPEGLSSPAVGGALKKRFQWELSEAALDALIDILPNIDPERNETWVKVLHGIAGADGGTFEMWDKWSAKWPGYNAGKTQKAWDSLNHGNVKSGGGLLRDLAEKLVPDAFTEWKRTWEAHEVFDDGEAEPDDIAAAAAAVAILTVDDFRAVANETDFIHVGTRQFWKTLSVDANVAPVVVGVKADGSPKTIKATAWMRTHRRVEQLSWLPGMPAIVEGYSIGVDGLEKRATHSVFNLYRAPAVVRVANVDARPWLDLVRRLWPVEAEEILDWFAHRVQRPGEKVNHALVLGGHPGVGKDTVLEGVRRAIGIGNCNEIMPSDMRGSFNDFVKSVLLVVNELRDDATMTQYAFYEKSKTLIAAPPYTATINSKYLKQYTVPNVVGVVMTTNYRVLGLYLPPDDRRHLVCWSDEPAAKAGDRRLADLWAWLDGGGFSHVAAWLRARDISRFDPKAPPRKTQTFLDIVASSGSSEEWALQSKIEKLGKPKVLRIRDLKSGVFDDAGPVDEEALELDAFLNDRKYRRVIVEALGRAGYKKVTNPRRQDGRWKIGGVDEVVYGRSEIDGKELAALASKLGNGEK